MRTGSSASTRPGKNARLGVETITTFVRIARSAAKPRESFIRGPATPTSRAADEAGFSRPDWSSIGGKLTSFEDILQGGPIQWGWIIRGPCLGANGMPGRVSLALAAVWSEEQ